MPELSSDAELQKLWRDPPREWGPIAFWFWNDDLDEHELLRQIGEFHAKGFGGFVLHARIGLSRRVGYLTEEWFRLVKICVDEAKRLGMKVVLYDEGCYPSGSAQGRVVAEDPQHAAKCLISKDHAVVGPARGFWRPSTGRALGDKLVTVVLGREVSPGVLDPDSLTILEPAEHDIVRYDVPAGAWRLVSFWQVFSGGNIRGVFEEEDDRQPLAPPAGDILSPAAVACFIRLTHEQYYARLKDHFGKTIVAMFTDEPNPMGRYAKRGPNPQPFTAGFLDDLTHAWGQDARPWLAAMWFDCGPRTEAFRKTYDRAVHARLERVFYTAQSRWCESHGIALTGHPEHADPLGFQRLFQWPGQDVVWRYVTPGAANALEGRESVGPRAAASAAVLYDRPRAATEELGAYGWRLTLDETKWLIDWHLARGINTHALHATFYSVRGRRAYESEPDIGIHNVWWPHFGLIGDYLRRMCWLISGGHERCEVAVLTDTNHCAWSAARELYQGQVTFVYVDDEALRSARIEQVHLALGKHQRFSAVVIDGAGEISAELKSKLDAFRSAGGRVIESWSPGELVAQLPPPRFRWTGGADLRVLHYRKETREFYLLFNEGEQAIAGTCSISGSGAVELWDPMNGATRPWPTRVAEGSLSVPLRLERRQSLVLSIDSTSKPQADAPTPPTPGDRLSEINGPWRVTDPTGSQPSIPAPGDWAQAAGWETFCGTVSYTTAFRLLAEHRGEIFLDLGRVGDIAEVILNGQPAGVLAWAPYVLNITPLCKPGENQLEVRVTNSIANAYEAIQSPSGLIGPITLRS